MQKKEVYSSMKTLKLAIAICTRQRLGMLKECLDCIKNIKRIDALSISVIVIENDIYPQSAGIVKEYGKSFKYIHEPELGLSHARNRALKEAASYDWLLFIDDDEKTAPDILIHYYEAIKKYGADVYAGTIKFAYPENIELPKWLNTGHIKEKKEGEILEASGGGNVLISKNIIDGFHFNTQFNLSGGEDTYFFMQVNKKGYKIIACPKAVVTETISAERINLKYQLYRRLSSKIVAVEISKLKYGPLKAYIKHIPKAFLQMFVGPIGLLVVPVIFLINPQKGYLFLFIVLRVVTGSLGTVLGCLNYKTARYQDIQGY